MTGLPIHERMHEAIGHRDLADIFKWLEQPDLVSDPRGSWIAISCDTARWIASELRRVETAERRETRAGETCSPYRWNGHSNYGYPADETRAPRLVDPFQAYRTQRGTARP